MEPFLLLLLACTALKVAAATYAVFLSWRYTRMLNHVRVLDRLLCIICVQAFGLQHKPVWRAWAETMGDITVEVIPERKPWRAGT